MKEWINFELGEDERRMQVDSLEEDLKDGFVIAQLVGKLAKESIQMPFGPYVQSTQRQFQNLQFVLKRTREILGLTQEQTK